MRAAVATAAAEAAEEVGSRADTSHGYNGKHAWQQKEAAAHALYSRRLQVLPVSARGPDSSFVSVLWAQVITSLNKSMLRYFNNI